MKKIKIRSIRKSNKCYMCKGTGIEYHEYDEKFHHKCGVCQGKKITKFKLNIKIHNIEFEAMICNSKGSLRKKNKWCVEVFEDVPITEKDKDLLSMGYKLGETISTHHYMLDGWGKSIQLAYHNAIKNVMNSFTFDPINNKYFYTKKKS